MVTRVPKGTPKSGGQFAPERKPESGDLKPIKRLVTTPDDVGKTVFDHEATLKKIGLKKIMSISGGRVLVISDENRMPVGMALPIGAGVAVHVYKNNNGRYTVQRVVRGKVVSETSKVTEDNLPLTVSVRSAN